MARRTRHEALVNALLARAAPWTAQARAHAAAQGRDAEGRTWYRIENVANTSAPVEVFLYAEIGMWGVTADMFLDELTPLAGRDITLRVNSEGGEVFDGVAIYNALQRHGGRINAHVDGLAASAASFICMAADEIVMEPGSQMMIHDAMGFCFGNAGEARRLADMLDRTSDTIAMIYAERAGGEAAAWREVMREERWYDGAAAVEAKLADRVGEGRPRDTGGGQNQPDNRVSAGQGQPVNGPVSEPVEPARRPRALRHRPGTRAAAVATFLPIAWDPDQPRGDDGKWIEGLPDTNAIDMDKYGELYDVHDETTTEAGVTIVTMANGEMQLAIDHEGEDDSRDVLLDVQMSDFEEMRDALRKVVDADDDSDVSEREVELVDPETGEVWFSASRNDGVVTIFVPGPMESRDVEMDLDVLDAEEIVEAIEEQLARARDIAESPADNWSEALIALTTPQPVSSRVDDHPMPFWEAQA